MPLTPEQVEQIAVAAATRAVESAAMRAAVSWAYTKSTAIW